MLAIQVVEHLSPQELVDLVALTARKLKPGAKIVVLGGTGVVSDGVRAANKSPKKSPTLPAA